MNKKILAIILSIAMLVPAMAMAADAAVDTSALTLMQPGVLNVGMEIGYPPFEEFAEDGVTPIGYDVDFAVALGDVLGLEVNFVNTAWDGIFQGIGMNYDCVISAVTITEERKETMSFSDPYINNYQAVVVLADSDLAIGSFLDLSGMAVAVQKETTSDILMSDYVATDSLDLTISANEKIASCFTQLKNGEVDAVVVDSTVAIGFLASEPGMYKIAYQDESEPEQFGVAMGLNDVALQTAVNEAIALLTQEGFFQEITEYWFGAEE